MNNLIKKTGKLLLLGNKLAPRTVANLFHLMYYHSEGYKRHSFLGFTILQCPLDLQLYQELVFLLRPSFIVQTGVLEGGSIRYFAALLDLINAGPEAVVVGVDIKLTDAAKTLKHPRIKLIEGSSTDVKVVEQVRAIVGDRKGMVVLDSDHSMAHVRSEIKAYKDFVKVGSYMVVEDTNINGHPVLPNFGLGPYEAVDEFMASDPGFVVDNEIWRKNLFSYHQHGWLKRVRQ
jgi:cephalosporin hydroxylase